MNLTKLTYKDWQFNVDVDSTKELYSSFSSGQAESCGCESCMNFAIQREELYPDEIRELFEQMGIDYRKEIEVVEAYDTDGGLPVYNGWFWFCGSFEGVDCLKPCGDSGYECELVPITGSFCIGFSRRVISKTERWSELIQIEFQCELPWKVKPGILQVAQHNLQLLLAAPGNCLKKQEFKNPDGTEPDNVDQVIDLLLSEDLVEMEQEPEVYFLSQYGYRYAENGTWPEQRRALPEQNWAFEAEASNSTLSERHFRILKIVESLALPFIITVAAITITLLVYERVSRPQVFPTEKNDKGRVLQGEELKHFIDSLRNNAR